ncbi:DUF427 domain-containing protein [Sneathiella litorea]|uniref:DUF427 domain-containing protein n=1 Tax=Sneathiella litorea TaxID=2606216 RepID=A0A6L8W566_9PROT|nr:DUF427 domain-containing protein [Sneathiella litorea]MZR30265.1 DUF427 domain-containing protein [Sneathiella litorea]
METETSAAALEPSPGFAKNPEYRITLERPEREFIATLQGEPIAQTTRAIILREADYPPLVYFPPEDVRLDQATMSDKDTYCPYKGMASYWNFGTEANIAWSYEEPFQEMLDIKGYVSFYVDRLDDPVI